MPAGFPAYLPTGMAWSAGKSWCHSSFAPLGGQKPLAARPGSRLLRGAAGSRAVPAMAVDRSHGTTGRAAQ